MAWGIDRRLAFIETRLYWEGQINRKDLTDFFGISIPQASADIKRYIEKAKETIQYNSSAQIYVATTNFKPKLISTDYAYYFSQLLLSQSNGTIKGSFLGAPPDFYSLNFPVRSVNTDILRKIIRVINKKKSIEINYSSMNNPKPHWRFISPHAFGYDGFRWHLRAFCHNDNKFKDFSLSRILKLGDVSQHYIDFSQDIMWHNEIKFEIIPHPKLSGDRKKVIEIDYGMIDGELVFKVRAAFIFYVIDRLNLDEDCEKRKPERQQIVLKNYNEIQQTCKILESIKVGINSGTESS